MAEVWATLKYFIDVRELIRIGGPKSCLNSAVDLLVMIYCDS